MLSFTQNDGQIFVIVPEKYSDAAMRFFNEILNSGEEPIQGTPALRVITNADERHFHETESIKNIVMDKIEDEFGTRERSFMQRFYKAIEQVEKLPISKIHARRIKNLGHKKGLYPYRKIDTVIELLGMEKTRMYAEAFDAKHSKVVGL